MTSINFIEDRFVLKQAYLLLTRKCNLTCSHCIRSSGPSEKGYLDTQLATEIIKKLTTSPSKSTLMLSGGEPTLHPNFFEIASLAIKHFHQVVINTHGLRLDSLLKFKNWKKKPIIQISIDGDKESHEAIRGKSTFQKSLKNIALLSNAGFHVVIATTVTKSNIDRLHLLDETLKEVPFSRWNMKRIVGSGRADDDDDVSTSVWNNFVSFSQETFCNTSRIKSHHMYALNSLKSKLPMMSNTDLAINGANCGTGRSKLYINPTGTVYPCACMENQVVGDFSKHSFQQIKQRLSLKTITPKKQSICLACNAWNRCQGGCTGISERFDNLGDPRCPAVQMATEGI